MIILALDLSKSRTGFAFDGENGKPRTGSYSLAAGGNDRGRALLKFQGWLYDLIGVTGAGLVAYEAPIVGGVPTNEHEALLLIGLATATETMAAARSVRSIKAAASTVRKHFVSHGRPENPKAVVMARCKLLGWEPKSHDEADACALWDLIKNTHDRPNYATALALTGT